MLAEHQHRMLANRPAGSGQRGGVLESGQTAATWGGRAVQWATGRCRPRRLQCRLRVL